MPEQTAKPIPAQLNIAPAGKSWSRWKLVDGPSGFPTREAMEKYLCNPERVRELEECRAVHLATIDQQTALIRLLESQLEAIGAGGVEPLRKGRCLHQIAEPEQLVAVQQGVQWTPGENEWKSWCSKWFGPDSDDDYLAKAVFHLPPMAQKFAAHPTQQGLDGRDVFERVYAQHAIEYAGIDSTCDEVVQRIKEGRNGNSYTHLHDSGAWTGWQIALAAQAKQGGV